MYQLQRTNLMENQSNFYYLKLDGSWFLISKIKETDDVFQKKAPATFLAISPILVTDMEEDTRFVPPLHCCPLFLTYICRYLNPYRMKKKGIEENKDQNNMIVHARIKKGAKEDSEQKYWKILGRMKKRTNVDNEQKYWKLLGRMKRGTEEESEQNYWKLLGRMG